MRIEPPPSLAWASGTMRAATAAAEPPLEPPLERVEVPGVAGRAEQHRLGRGVEAELGRVGAAEDAQARALVADHGLGIDRRGRMGEEARARGHRHARLSAAEVLQQERHAGERRIA